MLVEFVQERVCAPPRRELRAADGADQAKRSAGLQRQVEGVERLGQRRL